MKRLLWLGCLFLTLLLSAARPFDNFEYLGRPLQLPDVQKYQAAEGVFAIPEKFTVASPESESIILEQLADELKRFPWVNAAAAEPL